MDGIEATEQINGSAMPADDIKETRGKETRAGVSVTVTGVVANIFLIIFKFVAGIFGHSHALIIDAVHSVSDLFTDVVVLFGLQAGRKAPDEKHHFGHARIETMASAFVGLALLLTAFYLGIDSALNIYNHVEYHPTGLALLGAGISILLKEALYHYTVRTGKRLKSQLIIANAWHHRSDALSSVAVLIGVGGAIINPSWHMLDSFAGLLVSFFIVKVGLEILGRSLREFTDASPSQDVLDKISACAESVEGVLDIHDLRVRITAGLYQMEIHIVVDGRLTVIEGHRIAKTVEACLFSEVENIAQIIVHVDPDIR
ncbi:MAG: cation transporter [Bacteroidales bacterium]|nr:cation transporter [Bacteroidales bacterium]